MWTDFLWLVGGAVVTVLVVVAVLYWGYQETRTRRSAAPTLKLPSEPQPPAD